MSPICWLWGPCDRESPLLNSCSLWYKLLRYLLGVSLPKPWFLHIPYAADGIRYPLLVEVENDYRIVWLDSEPPLACSETTEGHVTKFSTLKFENPLPSWSNHTPWTQESWSLALFYFLLESKGFPPLKIVFLHLPSQWLFCSDKYNTFSGKPCWGPFPYPKKLCLQCSQIGPSPGGCFDEGSQESQNFHRLTNWNILAKQDW